MQTLRYALFVLLLTIWAHQSLSAQGNSITTVAGTGQAGFFCGECVFINPSALGKQELRLGREPEKPVLLVTVGRPVPPYCIRQAALPPITTEIFTLLTCKTSVFERSALMERSQPSRELVTVASRGMGVLLSMLHSTFLSIL